ncbi:GIY-YIG nuclease family protein [Lactobacillus sp. R2/2]|nr:GIY-YIG nuclease family protein [Lactobacillus sp. R2/2]
MSGNKEYSVYVGETNDIQRRTIEHLGEDPKVRVDFADFKHSNNAKMYVIGQEHFNKSMTLDIENRLMQYLSSVSAVSRLNNRRFNEQNKYYDSEEFDDLFKRIWSELHKRDENLFPDAEDLKTKAILNLLHLINLQMNNLKVKTEVISKLDQALRSATSLDGSKIDFG